LVMMAAWTMLMTCRKVSTNRCCIRCTSTRRFPGSRRCRHFRG
jgi:hypothetical protein